MLGIVAIVFGIWIPVPLFGLAMMFIAFLPAVLGYVVIALSVGVTALWLIGMAGSSSSTTVVGA